MTTRTTVWLLVLVAAAVSSAEEAKPALPLIGFTELRTNLPGGRHANVRTMRAVVVRADGTGRQPIADQLADEPDAWTQFAGWSPDGKRAIVSRGWQDPENAVWEDEHKTFRMLPGKWSLDTCLVDMATGKVANVTAVERVSHYNGGLFFLPDGRGLGFTPLINGISKPFVMDLDGRNKRDVSGKDAGFTYGYSASPDGKLISYHENYQIYIANADGSEKRHIRTGHPFDFAPRWSPDGEWLLFVSGEHYDCHPHIVRRDGTGLTKLADRGGYRGVTEFLDVFDFHGGSSDLPVWSADGKSVFYTAKVGNNAAEKKGTGPIFRNGPPGAAHKLDLSTFSPVELFQVNLAGESTRLTKTTDGTSHYHPTPSANGQQLLFGSKRGGVRQLVVMNLADRSERQITTLQPGRGAMWPHWQPLPSATSARDPGPLNVGLRKQLFVDDFVVAEQQRVTRVLGSVTKANYGRPIFTDGWFYGTVLHDDDKFKLWFRKPGTSGFGYAESADGLNFQKKADLTGINFAGDFTLAVEADSAETDPRHRFKAGYDAPGMAAGIAHSADGIAWTPYHDGKPVTKRAADTYNQILWDPEAKTYRLFTRTDFGTAGGSTELRGTRSMINPAPKANPANWSLVREWIFDKEGKSEAQRRQIYATTCWIDHGVYFALLSVYEFPSDVSEGQTTDTHKRHERDVMNFYIATSRDGDSWDLHWVYAGQPLIPRGPDGSFDKDIVLPASTIVTHADKHWLYYAGANERHGNEQVRFDRKHAIGLATLRLDRFVGLSVGELPGTVVTKPFKLEGNKLLVNVDAHGGAVSVEVLDENGQPFPGYSGAQAVAAETVDELRWQPRWKQHADLSALRGRIVRLKFHLRHAVLFAFQFHEE